MEKGGGLYSEQINISEHPDLQPIHNLHNKVNTVGKILLRLNLKHLELN